MGPDGILGRAGTEGLSSLECLLAQKAFINFWSINSEGVFLPLGFSGFQGLAA